MSLRNQNGKLFDASSAGTPKSAAAHSALAAYLLMAISIMDGLLPGAGVGLRFKLDKKNHINYRIDFAFGREGHTLSIGVGEAF